MTTGYILILAILILGGAIATLGDRIGTKVGKARLSLFNLRPRKTAVLITILTGTAISAATLGVLLAADKQLRTGVFELEEIQQDLEAARTEIAETRELKARIERRLAIARAEQVGATRRLEATNKALRGVLRQLGEASDRQAETEMELEIVQTQLERTEADRRAAEREIEQVQAEKERVRSQLAENVARQAVLRREITELQGARERLLAQQATIRRQVARRDREIRQNQTQIERQQQRLRTQNREIEAQERLLAERESQLADREIQLAELEEQKTFLERELSLLERDAAGFRQRRIAIVRNQILASGVVRILEPEAAPYAIDELLSAANEVAWELVDPSDSAEQAIVQITRADALRVVEQIGDGEDYVLRVFSAGNYVEGEQAVQVFIAAQPNELVFDRGETIASIAIEPQAASDEELVEQLNWLLQAVRFRATQAGIPSERLQIGDGRRETLVAFLENVKNEREPLEIEAIAARVTETADELQVELVASRNGTVLFETG